MAKNRWILGRFCGFNFQMSYMIIFIQTLTNINLAFPTCTVYQNYYECLNKALNVSVDSSADLIMKNVNPPCFNSCKMGKSLKFIFIKKRYFRM